MKQLLFILLILICETVTAQNDEVLNILFKSNQSIIPDSAKFQLIKKVYTIKPGSISIIGHCDSIGSYAFNEQLSLQRANAVKKILLVNGIESKDIKICTGYGEQKPVNSNRAESTRQFNRRVEVQFLEPGKMIRAKVDIIKDTIAVATVKPIAKKIVTKKYIIKDSLVVGKKIELKNLFFVPGLHRLKETSYETLDELSNILEENPSITIEIQGHVCCTFEYMYDGTDLEYNSANLSVTRAKEIYEQLISRGIDKDRLRYKGFGGSRKINKIEITEEDKAANRRVEILILTR
jgi:outer membrane protein OmpA-like peptidoglycan-associated protein